MNFLDINCSIGGWPFRHVPRHTAAELRADLEALGCLGALVANNGSVLYNDTREANRELAEAIRPHAGFFLGCATVNPLWPQAVKELEECATELKLAAVRLLPRYHDYEPAAAAELCQAAARLDLPVIIPAELVNFRQRHRMEPQTPLAFNECRLLFQAVPDATFVWLDGVLPDDAPDNVLGEFNRAAPDASQCERLLLGTGMPLRSPAALAKLEQYHFPRRELRLVTQDNFRRLFHNLSRD